MLNFFVFAFLYFPLNHENKKQTSLDYQLPLRNYMSELQP